MEIIPVIGSLVELAVGLVGIGATGQDGVSFLKRSATWRASGCWGCQLPNGSNGMLANVQWSVISWRQKMMTGAAITQSETPPGP